MLVNIVVLIVLILINGFFAASEIAFLTLNELHIEALAKDGNKKAKIIMNMLKEPSKFLATIQIGVTLAGFLSSAFAADVFADRLSPILYNNFPILDLGTWQNISIVIVTIILSYFTLVLGELVPKRIAMKYYEKISFATIRIIKIISTITSPFVKLLTFTTNAISRLFGISENEDEPVTEDQIRMMVDAGEKDGTIEETEKEMIDNVFEFNNKVVSEIMIPRNEIFAIEINSTLNSVMNKVETNKRFSRIPVYSDTIDNIEGFIHIKDLFLKNIDVQLSTLVKPVYFVPETKPLDELFRELRKNKKQLAIVIDEHGGTAGLVTMEDILEEIVGEIYDEYDKENSKFLQLDNNTYIIDGTTAIYDVEKILDIEIDNLYNDTLSGFLIEKLGKIPDENEHPIIEIDNLVYKVEEVKNKTISKVKVCKNI